MALDWQGNGNGMSMKLAEMARQRHGMAMAWQGDGKGVAMNWLEERKNNTYAGFRIACPPCIRCLLSVVEQKA